MKWVRFIGAISLFFSFANDGVGSEPQRGPYRMIASVPGGAADGLWDYATVDVAARRLYLAQEGVTVLDLDTGKVTPHFVVGKPFQGPVPTHAALPVDGGRVLAVSDDGTNSVDFFDSHTGKLLSVVSLGPPPKQNLDNPDWLLYETHSKLLVAVNGDSSSLSLVDTTAFVKRADIPVGKGKLEAAVGDGAGLIYINEERAHSIAVVDVPKRKVIREIVMKDCEEPTAIAFDTQDRLVMSVCSNGLVKFIAADTSAEVAHVKVGRGADGLVYDSQRHFLLSFGGDAGTLSVIVVHDRQNISLVQTLKTKPGARLGAVDPKTGYVYIPAATFGPPARPITLPGLGTLPGLNPHTFEFLVVAPSSD